MSRSVQRSQSEKKTGTVTSSAVFHPSLKLMLNLCTLGGNQRASVLVYGLLIFAPVA